MEINTIVLISSSKNKDIVNFSNTIEKKLKKKGIKVIHHFGDYDLLIDPLLPDIKIDLAMAVGGDGTALRTARICAVRNIPILPVKMGWFGFINEILEDEWEEALEFLQEDKAKIGNYHLLETCIGNQSWLSFNDVTICSAEYGTISTSVFRQGELITRYRADGIIISTPTGSTGHSLSAGGPIISPGIDAFMINPIAPFTLSNRPIIISIDHPLTIEIEESRYHSILVVDGRVTIGLLPKKQIIVRDSNLRAKIVHSNKRSYFEILRDKLGWAGEFRA